MSVKVKKAVIPAAGFGTRFLPFTKSVPKELIPLVDKPVIQYVVEEAVASGIEEILLVISSDKEPIIRHFNPVPELERRLDEQNKTEMLQQIREISKLAKIHYVYQQELNGLGDAVARAQYFTGSEPFAVLLGDTVMDSFTNKPVTRQLADVFERTSTSVVALEEVPLERVSKYGIADGEEVEKDILKIRKMVEKPSPENAPGRLAFAARYIFTPEIFAALAATGRGKNNEIQLTDAMQKLLASGGMYGCKVAGKRYDIGSKSGFLKSTVEFALRRPEFREEFLAFLRETVTKFES
ncbi:MAG: UTP--glucose-1-phosphate uridylyltransferase GalU [Lentisphaeria bacterium]|nr:UTP--glucose-1-phosphate uridylyltransferase GalU [Lentisphaeria bacterium]